VSIQPAQAPADPAPANGAPPAEEPPAQRGGGAPPPEAPAAKEKRPFPSALTVLVIVAIGVWAIALVLPSGEYRVDSEGAPIRGTYHHVASPLTFGKSVRELVLSPVNGLYGIESSQTRQVSPSAEGSLFGGAEIFLFVLAVGAFIAVSLATGALDRGMNRLAWRTHKHGWMLIAVIMVVFSVLGSVEGFAEETLAFYGLLVPLMLALGYDRMVAVGAIIVGAGVGVMGATVNPFSIGIASGFAKVSIIEGMPLRLLMWAVMTAVAIWWVLRYAAKVRADPDKSVVGFLPGDRERALATSKGEHPPLQGRDKMLLAAMGFTFVFMIYSIMPFAEIFSGSGAKPYAWQLGWSFSQLSMLFVVAAVIIGVLGRLSEKRLTDAFMKGMGEFLYPAAVIVLARGVTVIMHNAKVTDTVLHAMEHAATSVGKGPFAVVMFIINLPLGFLIPSTSGFATLAMPILAPLSEFAHVSRGLTITAWNASSGWMNLWIPTTAVVVGGVALAKVPYNKYLRWLAPLLGIYLVLICAMLGLGAALG